MPGGTAWVAGGTVCRRLRGLAQFPVGPKSQAVRYQGVPPGSPAVWPGDDRTTVGF
jgi:hypothetical protein